MAAAVPVVAAVIAAGSTIYAAEKSSSQAAKAREMADTQKRQQDAELAKFYSEQDAKEKEYADSMAAQELNRKTSESMDKERDDALKKKKMKPGAGGVESTILTGPQGLNYESQQKTLIGG